MIYFLLLALDKVLYSQWRRQGGARGGTCPPWKTLCPPVCPPIWDFCICHCICHYLVVPPHQTAVPPLCPPRIKSLVTPLCTVCIKHDWISCWKGEGVGRGSFSTLFNLMSKICFHCVEIRWTIYCTVSVQLFPLWFCKHLWASEAWSNVLISLPAMSAFSSLVAKWFKNNQSTVSQTCIYPGVSFYSQKSVIKCIHAVVLYACPHTTSLMCYYL